MTQRLPPFNALRAFESAARHLSFKRAAEEMHVTPAAISHQIKALEEQLGVALFARMNRGLALTAAARACLPSVRTGLEALADAMERIRAHRHSNVFTVSVAPSFASRWLMPRLHRFASRHPEIELRIVASTRMVDLSGEERETTMWSLDFQQEGIDVAIRFGRGDYPGVRMDQLFAESLIPVCSPKLLRWGDAPPLDPEALHHFTLLHDDTAYFEDTSSNWTTWLERVGVEGIDSKRGPHFSEPLLSLGAAADGLGIALSLRSLASADIAAGRLVAPFDLAVPLTFAYWAVYPEATIDTPRLVAFREWLLSEVRRDRAAASGADPYA